MSTWGTLANYVDNGGGGGEVGECSLLRIAPDKGIPWNFVQVGEGGRGAGSVVQVGGGGAVLFVHTKFLVKRQSHWSNELVMISKKILRSLRTFLRGLPIKIQNQNFRLKMRTST